MFKKLRRKLYGILNPNYRQIAEIKDMITNLAKRTIVQNEYIHNIGIANFGHVFGYNFKEYFIHENIPERIKKLTQNLDEASIDVINQKIEHFLNFPLNNSTYETYCRFYTRDILYTPMQIKENQDFIEDLPNLRKKYKGDFDVMVPEVFKYHHGLKFLNASQINLLKDKTFIDAGAFWGDSSLIFNEYSPKEVYAFEMLKSAEEKYYNNLKLNNIDIQKYKFINAGVSNTNEKILINGDTLMTNFGMNGNTEVDIVRLDDYLKDINNIGLIKMDIEGAEFSAIEGAFNIIKNNRPLLLISIYHTPKEFFELKPLIESLDLNYKFMVRNLNFYRYGDMETTLICIPE